jgi:hypothetical protein
MEILRIFLDHLYFSIICVGIGAIVVYVILYGIGEGAAMSNHLLALGIACGLLCSGLAGLLTHRTLKSRVQRPVIYTRRQY